MNLDGSPINWEELTLEEDLSYEEFKGYMKRADGLIGGGSKYSEDFLPSYGSVPVTFWEAREEYLLVAGTDRLFWDHSLCPSCIFCGVCLFAG